MPARARTPAEIDQIKDSCLLGDPGEEHQGDLHQRGHVECSSEQLSVDHRVTGMLCRCYMCYICVCVCVCVCVCLYVYVCMCMCVYECRSLLECVREGVLCAYVWVYVSLCVAPCSLCVCFLCLCLCRYLLLPSKVVGAAFPQLCFSFDMYGVVALILDTISSPVFDIPYVYLYVYVYLYL
jgi:hypothetical protein